jgi:hypothetical protein
METSGSSRHRWRLAYGGARRLEARPWGALEDQTAGGMARGELVLPRELAGEEL